MRDYILGPLRALRSLCTMLSVRRKLVGQRDPIAAYIRACGRWNLSRPVRSYRCLNFNVLFSRGPVLHTVLFVSGRLTDEKRMWTRRA